MTLSGSFYTNVGAGWRLQLEWSGTQSIENNTTTITANLYWISLGSSYTVNSSATKDCSIYIDGTWNGKSASGLASLSGNQKKLIHSYQKVVGHNADGTKSVTLDGWFDAEVTLSGVYYGRIDLTGQTYTLPTIPRASSLTSSASWTAGSDLNLAVSRASTSFTHVARISVNGVLVKTEYTIGTSRTVSFTLAENTTIFQQLAQQGSRGTSIVLETYNGSTLIGSKTYTGTVTAPNVNTTSWGGDFNIGDSLNGTITKGHNDFTSTVQLIFGTSTFTLVNNIAETVWTYDSDLIATQLYNLTPNNNTLAGKIRIYSYYNGVQVRTYAESNINALVTNSDPTLGDVFSYSDTNPITVGITNNNTKIIQGYSTVRVVIPLSSRATANNGATMVQYIATLNGVEKVASYSAIADVVIDFGTINAMVDQTLVIRAIDSRGNDVEKTKTVFMIPYVIPSINASAKRESGFENETTLAMNGEYSLLTINGINKNAIQSVQYRYKPTTVETYTTWDTWQNFTWSTIDNDYTATDVLLDLDNTQAWHVEFMVTDVLENIVFATTVGTGKPIVFMDSIKKSVGIGMFPTGLGTLETAGGVNINGTLDMKNRNIIGINSLTIADSGNAEGLIFGNTSGWMIQDTPNDLSNATGNIQFVHGNERKATIDLNGDFYFAKGLRKPLGIATDDTAVDISISDLNNLKNTGIYMGDRLANAPITNAIGQWGWIEVIKHNNVFILQKFTDFFTNNMWFRRCHNGTWQSWQKFSSVESSGSNANGDYIRYSDGLQVCWFQHRYASTAPNAWTAIVIGSVHYIYIVQSWTFPASFKTGSIPTITCSGDIGGAQPETHLGYSATATGCTMEHGGYRSGIDTAGSSLQRYYYAIGWWK